MQVLVAMFLLAGLTMSAPEPSGRDYAVGQVWSYKTRPQDAGSCLKIWRVEDAGALGQVYHISVVKVHLGTTPEAMPINHLPVSRETLDASVIQPGRCAETFPDPKEGIAEWRRAKGGVFTIPMADIVEIVDSQVRNAGG